MDSRKRAVPTFGTLVSYEIFKNQNVSFSHGKLFVDECKIIWD